MDFSQICRRREGWSVPLRLDILNKFYTKSPILDPSNIDKNKQEITSVFPTKTYRNYFLDFQQYWPKENAKIFFGRDPTLLMSRSTITDFFRLLDWVKGVKEWERGEIKKMKMKVWKWKQCHGWGSLKVGSWRILRLTKWKWKFDVWRLYFALGYFSFDVSEKDSTPVPLPPCLASQLNIYTVH